MKVKGPGFEIQEYTFDNVPKGTTDKYTSRIEVLDKYKDVGENTFHENMKLYDEVRKFPGRDVSLVTVRDKDKDTLNLAVTTVNKVGELRMNLNNIPTTDMIHLHKENGDIIYTDLLQETLQVSKLQSSKKRVEEFLKKEKVENKSHQT